MRGRHGRQGERGRREEAREGGDDKGLESGGGGVFMEEGTESAKSERAS